MYIYDSIDTMHTLLCAYFIVCSFYTMLCTLLRWCVISSCCCCFWNKFNSIQFKWESRIVQRKLPTVLQVKLSWNQLDENYKIFVQNIMENYIPHKAQTRKNRLSWFDRQAKPLVRKKQKLYNCAKKSGKPEDWDSYRKPNGPGRGLSTASKTTDGPRVLPLGDHMTRKYDKGDQPSVGETISKILERHDLAEGSTRQANLETACWGLRPTTGHFSFIDSSIVTVG